jgi:hypothetical protein
MIFIVIKIKNMSLLDKYNEGIKNKLSNIGDSTSKFLNNVFKKNDSKVDQAKNSMLSPKVDSPLDSAKVAKNFNSIKIQ